ncbi:MAG: DUF1015 domain-containing protein [Acidobacteriota bacterium]
MATVKPFQPLRYAPKAGDPAHLLTQPYDKISPEMQASYLSASPHNVVRIIQGERHPADDETNNVYTRSAEYFQTWIKGGILAQDAKPGFYAYTQDFQIPDTQQQAQRIGFIGLGKVEDYEAGIVFRHEQTLSGPKKDRMEILRHNRAHFGHIFMLYPDEQGLIDRMLIAATASEPLTDVIDEYGARHRLWAIHDPSAMVAMEGLMADKQLLIADGHHRYETALAYHHRHPDDVAAQYVMMTFINMYSEGLQILATHRVLRSLPDFNEADLVKRAHDQWKVTDFFSVEELKAAFQRPDADKVRIGMVTHGATALLERPRRTNSEGIPELDVPVLHSEVLTNLLEITEDAVREESFITYVRGMDKAIAEVREKGAQVAFLLEPTPIDDMAKIAFSGGVMPQKSTDFYPKLLTGLTIYKL